MSSSDIFEAFGVVVLIGLIFYLPRRFSVKQRAVAGIALSIVGWSGIFSGIALGNRPFLQNEAMAYAWMGGSAVCTVLGIICLTSAALDWLRSVRPRRRRRERWPS
jgi:xanthosine utilization system XapX-like protein